MVRNAAVEVEKKTRTIKAAVKPASGIHHPKIFMGMLAGKPSTQMAGLGSIEESNSMVAEAIEEHVLDSEEATYEDPGEHAPRGFMAAGGGFHDGNASHWWDQKHPSFPSQTCSENTNWKTTNVHMSVEKEAIRKTTVRVNDPLE